MLLLGDLWETRLPRTWAAWSLVFQHPFLVYVLLISPRLFHIPVGHLSSSL